MMEIRIPDPHPGRCKNYRDGRGRCLDYDGHDSACTFPDWPKQQHVEGNQIYSYAQREPEPWVSPLEDSP